MGYGVYEDRDAGRWAGYTVPALCDWPTCTVKIDRGMGWLCERGQFDGDRHGGCGEASAGALYFCTEHLGERHDNVEPKPDLPEWEDWILTDETWERWRAENPYRVELMQERADSSLINALDSL